MYTPTVLLQILGHSLEIPRVWFSFGVTVGGRSTWYLLVGEQGLLAAGRLAWGFIAL